VNRQVHLIAYPDGLPGPGDFALMDAPQVEPQAGEVQVLVLALGMDPFPRLRMRADSRVGPPLPLGRVVDGRGVGRVRASHDPAFAPGDLVAGELGWQEVAVLPGAALTKLNAALGPPHRHLSALGPSGLTAWFSTELLAIAPGDTVVIAPAAGSVGSIAGQLAAERGARVVGIASGLEQAAFLTNMGFAATVDARAPDLAQALAAACPDGANAFLDGVGGPLHDAVIARLALHARVVLLGFIAAYADGAPPAYGAAAPILFKRAMVRGFLLADYAARFDTARAELAARMADGRLRAVETIWDGLDQAPAAFAALFGDAAPGKQIVRVREYA